MMVRDPRSIGCWSSIIDRDPSIDRSLIVDDRPEILDRTVADRR